MSKWAALLEKEVEIATKRIEKLEKVVNELIGFTVFFTHLSGVVDLSEWQPLEKKLPKEQGLYWLWNQSTNEKTFDVLSVSSDAELWNSQGFTHYVLLKKKYHGLDTHQKEIT